MTAIAAIREGLRLKPDDANGHFYLGYALQLQEKLDEAIAAYQAAIRLKSDYAEAYFNLATVLQAARAV